MGTCSCRSASSLCRLDLPVSHNAGSMVGGHRLPATGAHERGQTGAKSICTSIPSCIGHASRTPHQSSNV
eukprot:1596105-Amphidinium_carterae.1